MPNCPNGHQSDSDDWCEVCGHRMTGPGAPAGAVPPPPPPPSPSGYGYQPTAHGPGGQPELCPQCRTPREPMAEFCEECRWNFLTKTATSYTPLAPQPGPGTRAPAQPVPGISLPPGFQAQPRATLPPEPYEYQGSRPSQVNRPAEPLPELPSRQVPNPQGLPPTPSQQGRPSVFQRPVPPPQPRRADDDDWMLPPPSAPQAPHTQAPQAQGPRTQAPQHQTPQHQAPQSQAPQSQQHQAPQHQDPGRQYQQPGNWTAAVGPDREYFMAMMQRSGPEATGLNLPAYSPEQHLPLTGNQVTIGRRRHSTGESPDIDLSVPPEDPGVSHQHALLVRQPDGSWAVVDQNSTNGTTINGAEDPIQPYIPVALKDGDRVHVGAWTTISIRRG
jgi:hypothetical protein